MYEADMTDLKVRVYEVSVDDTYVGFCDEPEVTVEKMLEPITLTQLHKQVMGHRILGVGAKAKFKIRTITKARMALAFPWYVSGSIPLMPTSLGGDTYDDAVPVTFHPTDMGVSTAEDITLLKGYPTGPFKRASDGTKDDAIEMEYEFYPDRGELPQFVIGTIGPAS